MVIALVAVALIATIAAVVTVNMVGSKEETPPAAEETVDKDALAASLDRVGELIAEGKWGKAGTMLDSVSSDVSDFPELVERAADYREQIEVGQLLVKARGLIDTNQPKSLRLAKVVEPDINSHGTTGGVG